MPLLGPPGHLFVIRSLEVDYRSSAGFDEELEVFVRTADLGGASGTTEFTDEVIKRVRTKLDVWSALGETTLRY